MKWIIILAAAAALAVGAYFGLQYWQTEARFLESPIYPVLQAHEPQVYQKLLGEYRLLAADPTRRDRFVNLANGEIAEAATRRIGHASQDSLLALMHDMVARMRRLNESPGDACYRFLFPHVAGPPDVARYFDPAAQAHTLELMAAVIGSAAEHPVPLPEPASVQGKLAPIVDAIYAEFGSDAQMLANAEAPGVDRVKVCTITISLYERILALPPADSSALIRAMTQL